jgi:hypothetical protein
MKTLDDLKAKMVDPAVQAKLTQTRDVLPADRQDGFMDNIQLLMHDPISYFKSIFAGGKMDFVKLLPLLVIGGWITTLLGGLTGSGGTMGIGGAMLLGGGLGAMMGMGGPKPDANPFIQSTAQVNSMLKPGVVPPDTSNMSDSQVYGWFAQNAKDPQSAANIQRAMETSPTWRQQFGLKPQAGAPVAGQAPPGTAPVGGGPPVNPTKPGPATGQVPADLSKMTEEQLSTRWKSMPPDQVIPEINSVSNGAVNIPPQVAQMTPQQRTQFISTMKIDGDKLPWYVTVNNAREHALQMARSAGLAA